jgi:hypothetical protein
MSLELTTTRRRLPLAETTFVTPVPPYIQRYIGGLDGQTRVRRSHGRLRRGIGATTFVTKVPKYRQTYVGGLAARMYDSEGRPVSGLGQHQYGPRGVAREMMGFGALDSRVSTSDLQTYLRRAGYCSTGRIDNTWGEMTAGALRQFAIDHREAGVPMRSQGTDWMASAGSRTVQIDSTLLAKIRVAASAQPDPCPTGGSTRPRGGGGGGEEEILVVDDGAEEPSVFSNPMLWLGVAAVAAVGYYAYTQSDYGSDSMLMMPPRL